MSSKNSTRLLIADDHQLVADGVKAIFESSPLFEVVGVANNGKEALRFLKSIAVDLVITDVEMPEIDGFQLIEKLRKEDYSCRIIVMTMHKEKPLVTSLLQLGADGFLLKSASSDEMLLAAQSVMIGNKYTSSEITEILLTADKPQQIDEKVELSGRELEILQLIAEGFSNKEIGEKIFISHRTVDKHRANMMSKIGARNVAELVRYAMRNELID